MARKVVGPTGSRRRRWLFVLCLVVALGAAAFFIAGAGAVTGTPSGFESGDGNMLLGQSGNTDWNCFAGPSNTGGFQTSNTFPPANCAVTTGATQTWADGGTTSVGSNEYEFKGGTKFDDECPVVQTGNNPPKDEWSNIAEYTEAASNHDLYFYGASIRPVVNGNSSGNVYFNQGTNPKGASCHTVGDVLLAFDFVNGGGTPSMHSLQWITSGSCYVKQDAPPCWGNEQDISTSDYDGNVNTAPIQGSDNGISGGDLPVNAFAEFGINLTQAIKDAGGTAPPCFASQTWVSRSSGSSFTSQPEDVENVGRATCGTITIVKNTLDGGGSRSGIPQQFSYSSTGGLTPSSFHLNDASGTDVTCTADSTDTSPCNTQVYSNVPAGSYTVTEGSEPAGFAPGPTPLSCNPSGTGTSTSISGETATITLGISGSVTCTYVNQQQVGAIRINKTSSKAAATPLAGASFYLCTNDVNTTGSCTAPDGVTNPVQTSGTSGTVCVASLPFQTYYVFESAAPGGYAIDTSANKSANVNSDGDCSSSTSQTVTLSFTDTPLTDLTITATSEATGGTKSAIFCKNSSNANVGNSPQPTGAVAGTTSTYGNPVTVTADQTHVGGLTPGTYTCTVYIDP
jgi:Prealbumin-like fold domain